MHVEDIEEEDDFQSVRLPATVRRRKEKRRKGKVEFLTSPPIGRVRPGARHRTDAEASARRDEALKRFSAEIAGKKRT